MLKVLCLHLVGGCDEYIDFTECMDFNQMHGFAEFVYIFVKLRLLYFTAWQ